MSACGNVFSESQRQSFSHLGCYLLDFKAILCFNWSLHCTVVFGQKATSPADKYEIKCLVVRQNGTNIHWSVPTSLPDPMINLYTSVVDLINFHHLVELGL